ncbi:MAG: FAD binding domain-containing protein [Betaproteobacteria bacterium]|jgi:carbon-monoxide dehydrogenase medium subunit
MHAFEYRRATNVADALATLSADPEARPISGGMTLIPSLKHRLNQVSQLVDIGRLAELRGIAVKPDHLWIGAATRHQEVADSAEVARAARGLAQLAGLIGDPQVRARGTLGGSVANNDPAADYPAAVLALDAVVVTGQREIAAQDFFQGFFMTALEPGELITGIRFALPRRSAYAKFKHPASGYAMAGVFAADLGDAGRRITVTGAGGGVFRWTAAEQAWLSGAAIPVLDHPDLLEDIHAPARYRANLARLMCEQAIRDLA